MYQFSRAIYRELAPHILATKPGIPTSANHEHVLRACEAVIERLAVDRHCFARPERTLFCDIRSYFPMTYQPHVHRVVAGYIGYAQRFLAENPLAGYASIGGQPPQCRATTATARHTSTWPIPRTASSPRPEGLEALSSGHA